MLALDEYDFPWEKFESAQIFVAVLKQALELYFSLDYLPQNQQGCLLKI